MDSAGSATDGPFLDEHLANDGLATDNGRQVGDQLANLVAPLQRLGPKLIDLGLDGFDPAPEFGVLRTEVVEFLGRHLIKIRRMCEHDRSPEQRR